MVVVNGPLLVNGREVAFGSLGRSYQCLCLLVGGKELDNRVIQDTLGPGASIFRSLYDRFA